MSGVPGRLLDHVQHDPPQVERRTAAPADRDRVEQFRVDADTVTQADVDAAWATWHAVTEAVGKVVDQLPLDTADRPWGRHDEYSLRWILLHLVEEYARHNGHADLLREAIDGATGE